MTDAASDEPRTMQLRTDKPATAVTWQQMLSAARTPEEVVSAGRDYLARFDHRLLARLPEQCRPPKLLDASDVADYAYELARYHCLSDDAELAAVVNDLSAFFGQAVARLSFLAVPDHRELSRLFG